MIPVFALQIVHIKFAIDSNLGGRAAIPRIAQTPLLVWTFRIGFRDNGDNIGYPELVSMHDEMLCGTLGNADFPY